MNFSSRELEFSHQQRNGRAQERMSKTVYNRGVKLVYQVGKLSTNVQILSADARKTPLLLIMGLSGTKEDWFDLPKRFSQDRPVLIFDNRFHLHSI